MRALLGGEYYQRGYGILYSRMEEVEFRILHNGQNKEKRTFRLVKQTVLLLGGLTLVYTGLCSIEILNFGLLNLC